MAASRSRQRPRRRRAVVCQRGGGTKNSRVQDGSGFNADRAEPVDTLVVCDVYARQLKRMP
jgi:hypothetical protein